MSDYSTAARSMIVAPRLPPKPKVYTGDPFTSQGEIVADCDVDGCTYHVWGERVEVKKALNEHHRLYHSDSVGVVLLNRPGQ